VILIILIEGNLNERNFLRTLCRIYVKVLDIGKLRLSSMRRRATTESAFVPRGESHGGAAWAAVVEEATSELVTPQDLRDPGRSPADVALPRPSRCVPSSSWNRVINVLDFPREGSSVDVLGLSIGSDIRLA